MITGIDMKLLKNKKGQATIELALSLPFIIWLMYYTLNAYYTMHTAHVAQQYTAMNLNERLNHRSKLVADDFSNRAVTKDFMAVQYTDGENDVPKRKIVSGTIDIKARVGICKEPGCN